MRLLLYFALLLETFLSVTSVIDVIETGSVGMPNTARDLRSALLPLVMVLIGASLFWCLYIRKNKMALWLLALAIPYLVCDFLWPRF